MNENQSAYNAVTIFFTIATVILLIAFWPIIWPVLWKVYVVAAVFIGVLYLLGAILEKLSEKHCPNDGRVMEYNSYGGFECPKCKRYEKNGNVLQAGKR